MTNIKIREKLSTTALQSIYATMDNTVQFVSTEKERERQLQPEGTVGWTPLYLFLQFVSLFRNNYPPFLMGGGHKYVWMADDDEGGLDDHRSKERDYLVYQHTHEQKKEWVGTEINILDLSRRIQVM